MATLHTFTQQVWAPPTWSTLGGGAQVTTIVQYHNDYAILTQYLTGAAQTEAPAEPFTGQYRVTIRGDGDSVAFTLLEGDTLIRSIQVGGYGLFPGVTLTETITEVGLPATIGLFAMFVIITLARRRHA